MANCLQVFIICIQMLNLVLELVIQNPRHSQVILVSVKAKTFHLFFFSLFLNDLTEFISHAYDGLNAVCDMSKIILSNDEIEVYFKLYILLYADDTVILAESAVELQSALNAMFLYCKSWDLEVNPAMTKITIFFK